MFGTATGGTLTVYGYSAITFTNWTNSSGALTITLANTNGVRFINGGSLTGLLGTGVEELCTHV